MSHIGYSKGSATEGVICTIEKTNITVETSGQLTSAQVGGKCIAVKKLDTNKILIASIGSVSDSFGYLFVNIITIEGTTIPTITEGTRVSSNVYMASRISLVLLDTNTVFITYQSSKGSGLSSGIVCTIDGTTITPKVNSVELVSISTRTVTAVKLDANRVLILYGDNVGRTYLYGAVCVINDTDIIIETTMVLDGNNIADTIYAKELYDGIIFIVYSESSINSSLYGMICTIDNKLTVKKQKILLHSTYSNNSSITKLDNSRVLIAHGYSNQSSGKLYPFGRVLYFDNMLFVSKVNKSGDEILGVAKTSGTDGDTIKVIVPK